MKRVLRVFAGSNAVTMDIMKSVISGDVEDDYFITKSDCHDFYPDRSEEYKVTITVERVKQAGER